MTNFRLQSFPFAQSAIETWSLADRSHDDWPVVYTISNDREIYVGETVNAATRMRQHISVPERKSLKHVQVIQNERFNKSACLDLEAHLIRYFAADGKFKVLNGNHGLSESNYFEREKYRESFKEVFDLLVGEGYLTRPIPEIVNSDLFKYSPFKSLNTDQAVALTGILDRLFSDLASGRDDEIVIQGDPGTGKTIVAIYLLKLLSDIGRYLPDEISGEDSVFAEYFTDRYRGLLSNLKIGFVIPQQSLRKTVQKVFKSIPGLDGASVITPFDVGKSKETFDLLIVDETHRLGQRANQSSAQQNKIFKSINQNLYGADDIWKTQLYWIRSRSKKRILLIDANQTVRPADLPIELLEKLISSARNRDSFFRLSSQMRVLGGDDYIDFVAHLLTKTPKKANKSGSYDLRFFDHFRDMQDAIQEKNQSEGLARLVSGYAWDWVSKKNKSRPDIEIEGEKLFWNRAKVDWINSKTSGDEVGSIHTVQGYDLNYAGVIIGADLKFDSGNQTVWFDRASYFDKKGRENNPTLGKNYSDEDIKQFVINIYRVLLTRGIKGTYVYVVDEALRHHLRQFFPA